MIDEEKTENDLVCPFCGEEGFDKIGLKYHLQYYCEEYEETEGMASINYKMEG